MDGRRGSGQFETVADVMSTGKLITCKATTTVDEALEMLVDNRVTGLPVVDDETPPHCIGVVSDYDLLALEAFSKAASHAPEAEGGGLFPAANTSWKAFSQVKRLLQKSTGKTVGEVMTKNPICVRATTNLEDAAWLLLKENIRRLPVLNENGCLVGVLTRGGIVRAAMASRRAAKAHD